MDVFNKFYSTVSTTVSQLQGVLPGNPVTREYEVIAHVASAGPGLQWKIYSGYKKSTRQEASIFVFEKRQLERWPKQDRDDILAALKRGASQLTRLRHPQVLVVHHPCEESRDSLAFATEPVFASLANILGRNENTPVPPTNQLKNYKLFEVEIKYGLLQVGEGLAFLHNDAKILHHNLTPENIVVNQQGAWKIFGFDFCILNSQPAAAVAVWPWQEYKSDAHPLAQPELDYLAPECGVGGVNNAASDMFSLGVIVTALYNDGQPLFQSNRDWTAYKRNVNELKSLPLSRLVGVAEGLRDMARLMLNVKPELRPDEHEFIKIDFFNDVGVKTLNYLDSLFQWDNLQKSQFYKGLPEIIDKLPHRVCLYRVIPCLVKEFVNPTMVPFVLPNVLTIAENCSKEEFTHLILPHLKPVMKMTDPIQILLIFMQKMELLLKLCPCEDVKTDVLPMLYRALEADAQQIQELCLSVLPTYATLIEYPAMKNSLLPRIKRLCISTSSISVRVNCLVCVGKLLEHLDKWLVLDEVLPFLPQIPSREPAVLMGILGIYKLVLTHKKMVMTKEVMATKVIPFLMPLSIENALTLSQFNAIIAVVKEMVNRVEAEHRVKLDQLNSIQNEQQAMDANMSSQLTSAPPSQSEFEEILGMRPSAAKPATTPTLNPDLTSLVQSKPLSLQDKQGYAKSQEASRRLQQEPTLTPAPAPQKAPPPVRDLTASLVENNLRQMSLAPSPQAQAQAQPTWSIPPAPVTPAAPMGAAVQPAWAAQSWRPPPAAPAAATAWSPPHQMPAPPQFTAFPGPQFQPMANKVPMNSLVSQPRLPMMNGMGMNSINGVKPAQTTKQLSTTEINDFLS